MTTVRVPVRVCVEVTADRADARLVPLVVDAVDAALGRAVRKARTVHAVTRAGGRAVPPAIDVRLTGDPLPDAVARDLTSALRTSAGLAAARLTGPPLPLCDQLPPPANAEPLDDDRAATDASGADVYRVPYYDRDGFHVSMRLQGVSKPEPAEPPPPPLVRLGRFVSTEQLRAAVAAHPRRPYADQFVVVYGRFGIKAAVLQLVRQDLTTGAFDFGVATTIAAWTFPGGEGPARLVPLGFVDADRIHLYGHAAGDAVRALWADAFMIDAVRVFPRATADQQRKWAESRARRLPPMSEITLYALTRGHRTMSVGDMPPQFPAGPLDLLVMTETDTEPREDTYGKDCPPLDSGEPGVWAALQGLLHESPSAPHRAFLGEPAIDQWPPGLSERFENRVKAIAQQLHMSPEPFVGGFLLAAMAHVDRRARRQVFSHAPLTPQLVEMAGAFGAIRDLYQEYLTAMQDEDARRALPCPVRGRARDWVLAFAGVFGGARDDAVASLFVAACQDILLQTLFATKHALQDRLANLDRYLVLTRNLLLVMLSDTTDLMDLRDALADQEGAAMAFGAVVPGATAGGAAWLTMTSVLVDEMTAEPERAPERRTVRATRHGWRVYDGQGRWWSRSELETLIAAQRRQATAVDPLLDKVTEVDDLVRKLKAAQAYDAVASTEQGRALTDAVDGVFRELIVDLLKQNKDWLTKAGTDRTLAFGLANFGRSDDVTNELGATLAGIHKLADELLSPAFTDHDAYVSGVSRLAAEEIGKAEIWEIVNLVGITALAILCPPAAFAVGVGQAIEGLSTAYEHRDLQRTMLDGDAILSRAQVEAELWSAWIGAALTVLPELPSVGRGAAAFARGETPEVAAALRQSMRKVAKQLAEMSVEHFTLRFARELTQAYLINLALSKAMNRIAEAVARQAAVTGGRTTSPADVLDVLGRTLSGGS